jgi:hypothetical protein
MPDIGTRPWKAPWPANTAMPDRPASAPIASMSGRRVRPVRDLKVEKVKCSKSAGFEGPSSQGR